MPFTGFECREVKLIAYHDLGLPAIRAQTIVVISPSSMCLYAARERRLATRPCLALCQFSYPDPNGTNKRFQPRETKNASRIIRERL